MFHQTTTSYLRYLHLVVHSAQQRFRFPFYVIQIENSRSPLPISKLQSHSSFDFIENATTNSTAKKYSNLKYYIPFLFAALCLIAAIALLSSIFTSEINLENCPIHNCSLISSTQYPNAITTMLTNQFNMSNDITLSTFLQISSTSMTTLNRNLLYGEKCNEHEECALVKQLFCQYEYDFSQKHCFCETSFFWNTNSEECEPKRDVDETCQYDNECRLDRSMTCDLKPDASVRRCRCMGEYYWSKISNCEDLKIQDFVNCIDEIYISSCLIKELDHSIYHNVNIRQIQDRDIHFDYFLLDSPDLRDIERIECCWSINKRYCFGIDSETNKLLIFIIDNNGIESYEYINQSVIGFPNVLKQYDDTIVCYIEGTDSNLLSIRIDPKLNNSLTINQRGKIYGERSCFVSSNRTTYCFYRDFGHRLAVIAMNGTIVAQDVQITIDSDTNLKTGPSCGWIGGNILMRLYCFAVFNDEKIHRIEQQNNVWSEWIIMPSEKIFIQRPLFVTSKPPDDMSAAQSCHVLAIDTSNEVYVSSNTNCAHQNSFSSWSLLRTDVGLLSFNGSFRLRDGRIGVYGIGIDDLPYYTTMDPITHVFEPIKLALTDTF